MDVFLSYSREDLETARRFVARIEDAGFDVWWDDDIGPTGSWDDALEQALSDAKCVLVLWSPASVKSDWVRTEAHFANDRGKLVPLKIAECELPLAFFLTQTVELTHWDGESDSPQWRKALGWIEELSAKDLASSPGASPSQWRNTYGESESGEIIFDGATVGRRTPGGTYFRDGPPWPLMCVVPRGEFQMGSPRNEDDRRESEGPVRIVTVPKPFAVGVYPVTNGEWTSVSPTPGAAVRGAPGDHPVTNISWIEARGFCDHLTSLTGQPYRLPTEAEWEYACRAGSTAAFAFGQAMLNDQANSDSRIGGSSRVGEYPANGFGLHDMHGNVREWVEDLWHENYLDAPTDPLPWADGHGSMHVLRGGSWMDSSWFLRSAARGRATVSDSTNYIGFRLARDIPD